MTLAGVSDRDYVRALGEVRDIAIAHGEPAARAWPLYLYRVAKGDGAARARAVCARRALRAPPALGQSQLRALSPGRPALTAQAISGGGQPVFDRSLERLLCVLVVAGAVKIPLGIPLYLNSALLLLGLFSLVVLQALPRLFLWMVGLIGLGAVAAWQLGIVADSGPRLAAAVPDPARHGADRAPRSRSARTLSRPAAAGDPARDGGRAAAAGCLCGSRASSSASTIPRQGGLLGEPNYNAMLCGVVGDDPGPASARAAWPSRPCSPPCRASVAA